MALRLLCVVFLRISASRPPLPLLDGDSSVSRSTMSSAKACISQGTLSLVWLIRLSTTRFHRNGERNPPCGQPLMSLMVLDVSWISTMIDLDLIMVIIHLRALLEGHVLDKALSMALKATLYPGKCQEPSLSE